MSEDFPAHLAGFRAGSLLAGYRLEAQVGAGGMAVVFRARDERLGRLVALKILAPALAADGAFRRRFIAESRAAAAVDDPHIIPVYEAGEAGGVLFIAMRFVVGGDLRGVLEHEGVLAPGRAAAFISPVASALDAAHRAGLVHRDVKPANILVDARADRPSHVYLSDFGVSKGAISSVSLTGAGHFVGTPDYSAPEQIQGLAVDGRADQYALACVAYQLLTVALNPKTGAILAMASYPSFDPNVLAIHDGAQLNKNDNQLLADQAQPLLNRALQGTYPPGSTFKIVTSSALLTQNPGTTINTNVDSPTQLTLPQTSHVLTNDLGEICGDGSGQAPLITAFAQSCDTTFAKIGMNVGAPALTAFAPYANPDIAVGVIIQGGGYGAIAAAPIAVQVIKAYLNTLRNQ